MSGQHKHPLQTEFEFTLPKGYVDAEGTLHRAGTMRLATAMDEIAPLRDPRVKANQAYLSVVVLARVITRLGKLSEINTNLVESLFTADLAYLQDFYRQINSDEGSASMSVTCPECQHVFEVETAGQGGRSPELGGS
jgi:hypothetical protein